MLATGHIDLFSVIAAAAVVLQCAISNNGEGPDPQASGGQALAALTWHDAVVELGEAAALAAAALPKEWAAALEAGKAPETLEARKLAGAGGAAAAAAVTEEVNVAAERAAAGPAAAAITAAAAGGRTQARVPFDLRLLLEVLNCGGEDVRGAVRTAAAVKSPAGQGVCAAGRQQQPAQQDMPPPPPPQQQQQQQQQQQLQQQQSHTAAQAAVRWQHSAEHMEAAAASAAGAAGPLTGSPAAALLPLDAAVRGCVKITQSVYVPELELDA
ncbi:hypothetical protein HYH02_004900 [Chlamydomonas schloesseri]|uniref:Uncharacterized protein n=1 Tax=Chlamydomonas schloesseri TaxID=2026947 RepID=A0A836B800_9CHLO|nr:hypothetical protein HYH02_004900 [Chlamydomonas schloesseri]|eukprot:KAG2450397.1 hypothetical protein HYH02_004900 [Chlamydomonas schloesseri]